MINVNQFQFQKLQVSREKGASAVESERKAEKEESDDVAGSSCADGYGHLHDFFYSCRSRNFFGQLSSFRRGAGSRGGRGRGREAPQSPQIEEEVSVGRPKHNSGLEGCAQRHSDEKFVSRVLGLRVKENEQAKTSESECERGEGLQQSPGAAVSCDREALRWQCLSSSLAAPEQVHSKCQGDQRGFQRRGRKFWVFVQRREELGKRGAGVFAEGGNNRQDRRVVVVDVLVAGVHFRFISNRGVALAPARRSVGGGGGSGCGCGGGRGRGACAGSNSMTLRFCLAEHRQFWVAACDPHRSKKCLPELAVPKNLASCEAPKVPAWPSA
jgi:hypothetical protein